jgi:ectoine hydroxylase-related dioxygenase (phytanoyl-CoA dioxygenase family)
MTLSRTARIGRLQVDLVKAFSTLPNLVTSAMAGNVPGAIEAAFKAIDTVGFQDDPDRLAYELIATSLVSGLKQLILESVKSGDGWGPSVGELDKYVFDIPDVSVNQFVLSNPAELQAVIQIQKFLDYWLRTQGRKSGEETEGLVRRYPEYFSRALRTELIKGENKYEALLKETVVDAVIQSDITWKLYATFLQKQVETPDSMGKFSLAQTYVPLNAFYFGKPTEKIRPRHVVSLEAEISSWLGRPTYSQDAIRIVAGDPGAGKSSFAKMFAASQSQTHARKILHVSSRPLVGNNEDLFHRAAVVSEQNAHLPFPLLRGNDPGVDLLIIELENLLTEEDTRRFLNQVHDLGGIVKILLLCHVDVVFDHEAIFRDDRQKLFLVPFFIPHHDHRPEELPDGAVWGDGIELLQKDLREMWWANYNKLTKRALDSFPEELARQPELTANPLLLPLVAEQFLQGRTDVIGDLNSLYDHLVVDVFTLGSGPLRRDEFRALLEEIGLLIWHSKLGSTTIESIVEHCRRSVLGPLIEKAGLPTEVVKNSIAFFFFRHAQKTGTVTLTHSSFGDYLVARKIVGTIKNTIDKRIPISKALDNWVYICGPKPISANMRKFLVSEVASRNAGALQHKLAELFSDVMENGTPVPEDQPPRERLKQVRNAEEALLVALNACAQSTRKRSEVSWPKKTHFGDWFRRILGQKPDRDPKVIAAACLSFMDFSGQILHNIELAQCDLRHSKFCNIEAYFGSFKGADLTGADFEKSVLTSSSFQEAILTETNFAGADLGDCDFTAAQGLENANFSNALQLPLPVLRSQYRRDGVICLKAALDHEAIQLAEETFNWSLNNPGPAAREVLAGSPGAFYQDHANPNSMPVYRELLSRTCIPELVANLLGSRHLWLLYEQIWLKEGGSKRRTPWHQDLAYIPLQGNDLAVLWITLDPVAKEDSLEFVPGSHRGPLFNPTAFDPNDEEASMFPEGIWPPLPNIERARDQWDIVSWPTQPGDILVFHPAMLHGGAPTHEGGRRRSISLRFFGDHAFCAERP